MRRRKIKNKKITVLALSFILILTVSYAAFQTNINLKAKGNIYNKGELCFETKDKGDGTVEITSYDDTCGTEVVIPKTIKGKTVVGIENGVCWSGTLDHTSKKLGAFSNRKITKVTFPDTITKIGNFAFYRNSIKEIDIPETVTYIGTEAFKNNQLTYVKLPNNLKTINALAFADNKITEVNIPNSVTTLGGGAFVKNRVPDENAYIYGRNKNGIDKDTLNSYAGVSTNKVIIPNVKILDQYSLREINQNESLIIPIL